MTAGQFARPQPGELQSRRRDPLLQALARIAAATGLDISKALDDEHPAAAA
jgi:hypothetical protein